MRNEGVVDQLQLPCFDRIGLDVQRFPLAYLAELFAVVVYLQVSLFRFDECLLSFLASRKRQVPQFLTVILVQRRDSGLVPPDIVADF